MDERQQQIKEGAGLDESRLNQDFIDLLKKWNTPVLLILAIIAFSYFGYQRWQKMKIENVNIAFDDLETVIGNPAPLPDQLRIIAEDYADIRSVALIAKLDAADAYMQSVVSGVMPGLIPTGDGNFVYPDGTPTGTAPAEGDQTLTEQADRDSFLAQAKDLYSDILDRTQNDEDKMIFAVAASFGLVAAAETEGDTEAAKSLLASTATLAENAGFDTMAQIARDRIDSLDDLAAAPALYAAEDLPTIEPPAPSLPDNGSPVPDPAVAPEGDPAVDPTAIDPSAQPEQQPGGEGGQEGGGESTTGEGGGETTTGEGGGETTTGGGG